MSLTISLGPGWVQGAQCNWPCNVVVFCYSSACYFSANRWFDVIFFSLGFCHFLKLPWGNFEIGSKRHCCLTLLSFFTKKELSACSMWGSYELSAIQFKSVNIILVLYEHTRIKYHLCHNMCGGCIKGANIEKLCQTCCRDWHSAKKCCLVSGPESQSLQVGSTANWLNTAQLLWRWETIT